jgi:hypothetical protein
MLSTSHILIVIEKTSLPLQLYHSHDDRDGIVNSDRVITKKTLRDVSLSGSSLSLH